MDKNEFGNRLHYGESVACMVNRSLFTEAIMSSLKSNKKLHQLYSISKASKI